MFDNLIEETNNRHLNHIKNDIYLSQNQMNVLNKYNIDYTKFNNTKSLIFTIEDYINDAFESCEDLEKVSEELSEFNYYNNTNK